MGLEFAWEKQGDSVILSADEGLVDAEAAAVLRGWSGIAVAGGVGTPDAAAAAVADDEVAVE